MQVRRLFFIPTPERDEGAIVIHRCEGEQTQEDFLFDQRKYVRYPRLRA
jgi:hypothetical protein